MKKFLSLTLAIVMALSLVACGGGKKAEEPAKEPAKTEEPAKEESGKLMAAPMTFKVCFTENLDTAIGTHIPAAMERITELTNGELQFEICPSAQLGSNPECMEQLINGAPIITAAGFDNMSAFVPECSAPCAPYVFESIDEIFTYRDTDEWTKLSEKIVAAGYQPITMGSWGLRCFISTKPITCADDIKGMIVRMGNSAASQNYITVMGGTPATSAWADNYSMLQTGAIDACEAPVDLLYSSSLYEVCDYLCMSNHLATPGMFVISPTFWEQIPAEYQEIMKDEMGKAMEQIADDFVAKQAEYVQKFKDAGVTVCEDPDIASFAEYVPVLFKALGIDTAEYDAVRNAVA